VWIELEPGQDDRMGRMDEIDREELTY